MWYSNLTVVKGYLKHHRLVVAQVAVRREHAAAREGRAGRAERVIDRAVRRRRRPGLVGRAARGGVPPERHNIRISIQRRRGRVRFGVERGLVLC